MRHKRDLPWRNTRDPYIIWLSEIILQQTRVAQGLPYFRIFLEEFPTVFDLAQASEESVLRHWQGLGYYSRARNLHQCAKQIVAEYGGKFPENYAELVKLKGVGTYTAAAIASFAFKEVVPVIDGNVYRVISRIFNVDLDIASGAGQKAIRQIAVEQIDQDDPDVYNQAIMEFGALHCTPKAPKCDTCVFSSVCQANQLNLQSKLPVKLKKVKVKTRYFNYLVLKSADQYGMKVRTEKDIWQGLYDFYLIEMNRELDEEDIMHHLSSQLPDYHTVDFAKVSTTYKHLLTHQKIFAKFFEINLKSSKTTENDQILNEITFFPSEKIKHLPKPILIDNYLNEHIF